MDDGSVASGFTGLDAMPFGGQRWIGPHEDAASIDGRQIDAAVAAGFAVFVVPGRGVKGVTGFEVLDPGDVTQFELIADFMRVHGRRYVFFANFEGTADG